MQFRQKVIDCKSLLSLLDGYLPALALLSGLVNLLGLTSSIYMMQVYDRVLSSHSLPTLVALSALCAVCYASQGLFDAIRGQILARVSARADLQLARQAQRAAITLPLLVGARAQNYQALKDVETIRHYLSSSGPSALLDLPWMPLFLVFLFVLHPMLGWITVAAACLLCLLTWLSERLVHDATQAAHRASQQRGALAAASERNAEVLQSMGFMNRLLDRFQNANAKHLSEHHRMSDGLNGLSLVSKTMRMMLQSGLLGAGAYLVIKGEMSGGAIIAASIVSGRALAPIDAVIANWKSFSAARQAVPRLKEALSLVPNDEAPIKLPAPKQSVKLDRVTVLVPGSNQVVLADISLDLGPGRVAAVIGPSGAGKSSLARTIAGAWLPARGQILFDGAPQDRWHRADLGNHIGYLPQDVELFDGTVAENISRFDPDATAEDVLDAASAADVHQLIVGLPNGYETRIGPGGTSLSAGQRQRIGLARALFRRPFLVVLDEPNSNLDAQGEAALNAALQQVRARGGIAIVISHRPNILSVVDDVIVIDAGRIAKSGPRDEVMQAVVRPLRRA